MSTEVSHALMYILHHKHTHTHTHTHTHIVILSYFDIYAFVHIYISVCCNICCNTYAVISDKEEIKRIIYMQSFG